MGLFIPTIGENKKCSKPSWKIWKSMGRIIPYVMESKKKRSKPPTRYICIYIYIYRRSLGIGTIYRPSINQWFSETHHAATLQVALSPCKAPKRDGHRPTGRPQEVQRWSPSNSLLKMVVKIYHLWLNHIKSCKMLIVFKNHVGLIHWLAKMCSFSWFWMSQNFLGSCLHKVGRPNLPFCYPLVT